MRHFRFNYATFFRFSSHAGRETRFFSCPITSTFLRFAFPGPFRILFGKWHEYESAQRSEKRMTKGNIVHRLPLFDDKTQRFGDQTEVFFESFCLFFFFDKIQLKQSIKTSGNMCTVLRSREQRLIPLFLLKSIFFLLDTQSSQRSLGWSSPKTEASAPSKPRKIATVQNPCTCKKSNTHTPCA